ncbi:MAG: FKBP-type peptidyl-prolyl cis-trans isomerase [Candidatus Nanoperiomorbaceae bacterium]
MVRYNRGLSTPLWQRVSILVVGVVLVGGTIIGFITSAAQSTNKNLDPATIQQQQDQKQQQEQQRQLLQQQAEEQKTMKPLAGYDSQVSAFDAKSITSLQVQTLKEGKGAALKSSDTISANYTGWTADGKIFDSTTKNGSSASASFPLNQVIPGWTQGLTGKNVGGVYLLSIPTDLAYGSQGGQNGAPTGPLKFIVQIVSVK